MSGVPSCRRLRRRAAVAGLSLGLVMGVLGVTPGSVAADRGGEKPLTYGDCISAYASTRSGQEAKAVTEVTAPLEGYTRGGTDELTSPPGLADGYGIACLGLPQGR